MPKITKRVVDAASPKLDRYIIWDSEIKGFGLLVMPSGIKSYFYNYRNAEGRERRATIGKHGEWTPTQARAKAEDYREGGSRWPRSTCRQTRLERGADGW